MGQFSKIQWTHHTFNPWWGCSKRPGDPACHNCYAEAMAKRYGHAVWGSKKPRRRLSDAHWRQPLKWDRDAAAAGVRERVFCASMADVFEGRADLDPLRRRLWDLIKLTPNLDWLLLTKRPENIKSMLGLWPDQRGNVWLGTTAVTQRWYDERLPHLLENRAAVHFVSVEPQMEHIDLRLDRYPKSGPRPAWVIDGGESGGKARPFEIEWARSLRDQCREAGVAFFMKQLGSNPVEHEGDLVRIRTKSKSGGEPDEWPEDLRVREFPVAA